MTSAGAVVQGTMNECLRGAYIRLSSTVLRLNTVELDKNCRSGQSDGESLQKWFQRRRYSGTRYSCSIGLLTNRVNLDFHKGLLIALECPR